MKEKHKIHYVSPCMDCIRVEAESDFMSGSVMEHKNSNVRIEGHEVGGDYDFENKPADKNFDVNWE